MATKYLLLNRWLKLYFHWTVIGQRDTDGVKRKVTRWLAGLFTLLLDQGRTPGLELGCATSKAG